MTHYTLGDDVFKCYIIVEIRIRCSSITITICYV